MRIFLTGATGFVGSAIVQEMIGAGHQVVGLARSDESAAALATTGAEVLRGSIEDLDVLRAGTAHVDGVIHTAFNHDFSKFAESAVSERAAIEALGAALEGSDRPLLITSGVALLGPGRVTTEEDRPPTDAAHFPRKPEAVAQALAERGVRVSTVRLAPTTHGRGDHGFVPILIGLAREKGVSPYVSKGLNRWPAVHRLDAARIYRLALERRATGPFHAIAEQGVPFKEIAQAIGRGLGVPVVSQSPDEAAEHFGWFHMFAAMDMPSSSERTKAMLGWEPEHPTLLDDLENAGYF